MTQIISLLGKVILSIWFQQKMWRKLPFVSSNLMNPRLNNSRMQLKTVIGLNSSWVCYTLFLETPLALTLLTLFLIFILFSLHCGIF